MSAQPFYNKSLGLPFIINRRLIINIYEATGQPAVI